jgi:hypothetical protein
MPLRLVRKRLGIERRLANLCAQPQLDSFIVKRFYINSKSFYYLIACVLLPGWNISSDRDASAPAIRPTAPIGP